MDRPSDRGHAAQRLDERRAEGAEWRRQVPLSAQAEWKMPPDRADRSVGAGSATTRKMRGLTRSVVTLIVPPLPAPSLTSR
jgi:hypothetical protein